MGPGHYGVASAFSTAGCVCSPRTAEVIARMGLNHPWGVVEATFEPEMLKLGRLQAHRLQVRFRGWHDD
ncbi:type VI secretion system baseplate subunit TssK [Klebsiella pneumoniae]|nr:type VI secretion system baseplate subunit TssK [Klebsiella pneumoniae]